MKKTILILMCMILLVSTISAFEFDNKNNFIKDQKTEYGRYEIYNSMFLGLGKGSKIADIELKENTFICDGKLCNANITINLEKKGVLISDFRTYRIDDDYNIINEYKLNDYKIYIKENIHEEYIDLYGYYETGKYFPNGTAIQEYGIIGEQIIEVYDLVPYNIGEKVKKGNYEIIINAIKPKGINLDWQIKSNGLWTTKWALWVDNQNYAHGLTTGSSDSSAGKEGIRIWVNSTEINVTAIEKISSDTSTTAYIGTTACGTELGSYAFSGNIAVVNPHVKLSPNTYYWISADAGGASRTITYNTNSYPNEVNDYFNWTGRNDQFCSQQSGGGFNAILSINITIGTSTNVDLNIPANNQGSPTPSMLFNCTGVNFLGTGILNNTLIIDGVSNYSILNSTANQNLSIQTTVSGLSEGGHNWTCRVISPTQTVTATPRNFSIDSMPPELNLTQLGTIDYHIKDTNLSINWSVYDLALDTCVLEYAGINKTVTCSNNGTYINATSYSNRNVILWANDTAGNSNYTYMSWDYYVFQTGLSYTTNVVEGSTENFYINFTQGAGLQTSSTRLIYNGTSNLGSFTSSGNDIKASKSIPIPSVAANLNVTFNWNITMSDGTTINGTSFNQTISFIDIDNCSTYNKTLYNFTIYDEETKGKLNATSQKTSGKITIDIHSYDSTSLILNFSSSYNVTNPFAVCLNNNLSSGNFNYLIDTQVQYGAEGYETELYHIQNNTLNSSSFPTVIGLYDLNSNDSQVFSLIFKDGTFLPVQNALIQVQRKYIEDGVFRTVEIPKTDKNGETTAHLVLEDVIYNFVIIKYGEVLATFNDVLASCQTPLVTECVIDFNSFSQSLPVTNYESAEDFNFTLGYAESTRTVSSSFIVPSGSPSNITLVVIKEDALGTSICTDTLTSSSGSLACNVSSTFGNGTVLAKLYKDGNLQSQGQIKTGQSSGEIYKGVQVLLSLFILLTLIGAGVSDNPVFTVIFLLMGVILLMSLNLVANNGFIGSTATILWVVVAIILVLIKGGKRN